MSNSATIASVTENLYRAMESVVLKESSSRTRRNMSQSRSLKQTVTTVKEAFNWVTTVRDSVIKVAHSDEQARFPDNQDVRVMVSQLRQCVYEVDDLVDEMLTQIESKQVRRSLSPVQLVPLARVLNARISDLGRHGFTACTPDRPEWMTQQKLNWHDNFLDNVVVGREEDVKAVVDKLLYHESNDGGDHVREEFRDYYYLAIVGGEGIGKTSVAKLVYNHARIRDEFSSMRCWVTVSDCGDTKAILRKIIGESDGDLDEDLQERFGGKKFLVVLDDFRMEMSTNTWLPLGKLLHIGARGSRIMITTRSSMVNDWPGDRVVYELDRLSEDKSRYLFEMIAFDIYLPRPPSEFVGAENTILQKICSSPPLIIKLVAGFLYGDQYVGRWKLFQEGDNDITVSSVLRLSYNSLTFQLKSCFTYCALFPPGFVIDKKMLISLWMAQGYLIPRIEGEDMEAVGEEYFCTLVKRGFLQVVEREELGYVESCEIYNQIRAFAQEAARDEIHIMDSRTREIDRHGVCHVFQEGDQTTNDESSFPYSGTIRSYLQHGLSRLSVRTLVMQYKSLRTLDLHGLEMKQLPESIDELLHLRYLDLSHNRYLETLPNSIVNLHNMQSLDLRFCALLKELPQGFGRLARLRCLNTFGCDGLTHMPVGLDKLTSLRLLSQFVVGEGNSGKKQFNGELRDLKKLENLTGRICILIPRSYTLAKRIDSKGGCLVALEHLREVWIRFSESHSVDFYDRRVINYHQTLLEKLLPHPNIKILKLWGYQGAIIPSWGRKEDNWEALVPNLVKFELRSCERLEQLPLLSKLHNLTSLKLYGLRELEFLEADHDNAGSSLAHESEFFPALDVLEIQNAPKLKRLWDGLTNENRARFPSRLVRIELRSCNKLQTLPSLRGLIRLKSLQLYDMSNLELLGRIPSSTTYEPVFLPSLEELVVVNAPKLKRCWTLEVLIGDNGSPSLPNASCFDSLKSLMLANLPKLRGFYSQEDGNINANEGDYDNVLHSKPLHCLSELRVSHCPNLVHIPMMPTITSLEAIHIDGELLATILLARHLQLSEECQTPSPPRSSSYTLRKVTFKSEDEFLFVAQVMLRDAESMVIDQCEGFDILCIMRSCSAKKLTIQGYGNLKYISKVRNLPWLSSFSSLRELVIENCGEMNWDMTDYGVEGLKYLRVLKLINIAKCGSLSKGLSSLECLDHLTLSWLYDLTDLPYNIGLLPHLRHLDIRSCPNLTTLPDSLAGFSSSKQLVIEDCPRLKPSPFSQLLQAMEEREKKIKRSRT